MHSAGSVGQPTQLPLMDRCMTETHCQRKEVRRRGGQATETGHPRSPDNRGHGPTYPLGLVDWDSGVEPQLGKTGMNAGQRRTRAQLLCARPNNAKSGIITRPLQPDANMQGPQPSPVDVSGLS